ncbi:30S ribosomal protein S16 [[Mycoplasma] testudinis]|uniref:30S ribosomal protein S16 n=1 Tax=[Mycoplasma] testudinis TaxID=33924 RepID=UPI000698479E|nr:30S ribosomal protein S16 [[Mycoplasma] testudinis]
MVKIRLMRTGRHGLPSYRIVVVDSRAKRDGKYIALLGNMDPATEKVELQDTLAMEWLQKGAQPTDTIKAILKKKGIWAKFMAQTPKASKETKKTTKATA